MPTVQCTAVMLIAVAWLALWPGTGAADPAEDHPSAVKLDPDAENEVPNVNELISSAAEYDAQSPEGSLQDYLAQVSLVSDADHLKVFANADAAETWFEDNDPEGVAFEYEVME